jgi:hypothetical protein
VGSRADRARLRPGTLTDEIATSIRIVPPASYGAASVGIELRGQERELHVLRPEHWFESR